MGCVSHYHPHSAHRGGILVSSIKDLVDYENHQTRFERMSEKFLRLSWRGKTTECWTHASTHIGTMLKNPQIHYKYIINIQCMDQIRFKSNIRGQERWKWKFRLKSRPKKDFVGWLTGVGRKEVKGILRERRKREREITERERERQASGQEVRKTRTKSRTALVANRNQFFVGPHWWH